MIKFMLPIMLFICSPSLAQFLGNDDYHSEFERKAFEQLLAGKTVDPGIFLYTVNPENEFEDYQHYALHIKAVSIELKNEFSQIEEADKLTKKVFKATQKESFKQYQLYENLNSLLKDGIFNCISGTAYYSLIFQELGFRTHIYETPYHVFLEIEDENEERILVESTDKAFGVLDNPKAIKKRREQYSEGEMSFVPQGLGSNGDPFESAMLKEIDLIKLAALQYYNSAVVEFNNGNFDKADKLLKKSSYLYPSSRIILLQMLSEKMTASLN